MVYIDNSFQYSTKIAHDKNGDNAFSLIFETSPESSNKMAVFCVMDGVSHSSGAAASSHMASVEIRRVLSQLISDTESLGDMDDNDRMRYIFSVMKKSILAADKRLWNAEGNYACTASIAVIYDNWVYTANIGDSPIYVFDTMRESITELFTCHNAAGYKVRSGLITKDEAIHDKEKNILNKVVGGKNAPLTEGDISTIRHPLPQDCVLLLGSDGALGLFTEQTLSDIIISNRNNMKNLCKEFYSRVIENNGRDDSTLIATKIRISY